MGKTRNSANLVSDNNIFVNIIDDRVGIGSTTPQYKVDVVGDINFTGSLNQGGSPFVASRWTTGTGDDIYRLNGDVGIGTTNPISKLHVIGDVRIIGVVTATTFVGALTGTATTATNAQGLTGTPNITVGIMTATSVNDSSGDLRDIPQNSKSSSYTLIASDTGKHISITTGGVTIPASVFSIGDAVTIFNNSGSNQTITQGASVTLRNAGTANTGNRTLAQYGICTILCVASNVFVISGAGLS